MPLKTVRKADCVIIDHDNLKDEKLAYLARKFKKFFRKSKRLSEKFKGDLSISKKYKKREECDRDTPEDSIRYHECQDFRHVKSEYPSYKKTLGKALNATLIDNKSNSNNQSENSNPDKG